MAKIPSRQEEFYVQRQSVWNQLPNTSGTATVASSDACAMIQLKTKATVDKAFRKDKTGKRTAQPGISTRRIAEWSANMSLVTGGTAGTLPDADPIFCSAFGAVPSVKTGTVSVTGATNATPIVITANSHGLTTYDAATLTGVGGNTAANGVWVVNVLTANTFELIGSVGNGAYTSGGTINKAAVVYSGADAELMFAAYSFRTNGGGTPSQHALGGAIASNVTFNIGEDIATFQASGNAYWDLESANFSNADSLQKMGLTAFPANPGSPVTLGGGIAGFKGLAYLNGSVVSRLISAQIKITNGVDLPRNVFNAVHPDSPEADERNIVTSFQMYEEDNAGNAALNQAAIDGTLIDNIYRVGSVAGNNYFWIVRGIQLASPDRDDSERMWKTSFGDSRAYGIGIGTITECAMILI